MPNDVTLRNAINPIQPGAYSVIDASQLGLQDVSLGIPVVAVLGTALGGQPNTPLYFRSPGALRQVLRSGVAYDAARFAFGAGASRVCVVRVGNSITQSSLALLNGTSATVVTLTSKDYGSWTTSIKVAVAATNVITITYTDAFGVTYTETFNPGASASAATIANYINGAVAGVAGSNYVTATAGAGTGPLANISATALAGGTDGLTPAASDWTTGISALEPEEVDILVPATGDATVHAQVLTHCQNMSLPNARKERTMVVGAVLGESVAQQVTRIGSLADKRVQLVYPGIQDYNASGVLTTYDPFYAAAKIAGLHAAQPDEATSLIHQRVPAVAPEVKLSTVQGGAVDTLLAAGVTPLAPAPGGGLWVVDDLSGYTTDDTFRSFLKIRSADAVAKRARSVLEARFVGQKNLLLAHNQIAATANALLIELQAEGLIVAYQTPIVQAADAKTYNVSLPVMLVDSIKFVLIALNLQPSSTVNRDIGATTADALS